MTYTKWEHDGCDIYIPVQDDDGEWKRARMATAFNEAIANTIVAAVNACAGVTLGEGASVKRLVEAANTACNRLVLIQKAGPLGMSPKWTRDLLDALAPFEVE